MDWLEDLSTAGVGHNSQGLAFEIEVRLFNSMTRYARSPGVRQTVTLLPGTTVGELASRLGIPLSEIFLVMVNGRDITPGLVGTGIREHRVIEPGDVVAFSGAVPYSYGYGSPVV